MLLFSWGFLALVILETYQCIGRPNYANLVFLLGVYLAILVDLRVDLNENNMAVKALTVFTTVSVFSCILDIWYLVFGSIVVSV